MKAMIFAAGLGTRLKPYTDYKPKALVEINGKPMLELVIEKLKSFGFNQLVVNVHHFSNLILDFLKQKNNFNINISISDETDLLLDTGGGLKKTAHFFDNNEPFLVHNVDIFSDIDLGDLYNVHCKSKALATLAVRHRNSSRYFLFNKEFNLCGWTNEKTGVQKISKLNETELSKLAFSGIHIISPKIFKQLTEEGIFSITDSYIRLCRDNIINAYLHDDGVWMDLGKPENILKAEEFYK